MPGHHGTFSGVVGTTSLQSRAATTLLNTRKIVELNLAPSVLRPCWKDTRYRLRILLQSQLRLFLRSDRNLAITARMREAKGFPKSTRRILVSTTTRRRGDCPGTDVSILADGFRDIGCCQCHWSAIIGVLTLSFLVDRCTNWPRTVIITLSTEALGQKTGTNWDNLGTNG